MREYKRSNTDDWSTVELAAAAGVNASRIRQLLIDKDLTGGYKLGRDWRVPDSVARDWLAERGVKVVTE